MIAYKENNVTKAEYTYDAEGYRASKTVGGVTTRFYWDRGFTANESDGTNFTAKNTIGGGGIVSRKLGTATPMYLMKDVHGDTTAVLQSGSTVGTYDYDAFGKQLTSSGTADNPYRYCGEYIDGETGFIYLRNRYYDPSIGRFISEDPYWNPANMIYGDNDTSEFKYLIDETQEVIQNKLTPCINQDDDDQQLKTDFFEIKYDVPVTSV